MTETTSSPGLFARLKARYATNRANGQSLTGKQTVAVICAGMALLAGYRILHRAVGGENPILAITAGSMPRCDSPPVRHLLKQTIDTSPAAKQLGLTVLKLGAFGPMAPDSDGPGEEQHLCVGTVFANAGQRDVYFSTRWTDTAKDELWLEVPQLPWIPCNPRLQRCF